MNRFWRTVSIAMGALLATGCFARTKYGIETGGDSGGDTGDVEQVEQTAAPVELPQAPVAIPAPGAVPESPVK